MIISLNYKRLQQRNYLEAQKKIIDKTKSGKNVPSLQVAGAV